MKLQPIDIFIIGLYLVAMIVIGLVLKKKASKNMDSYFLGGKTLPFYMLGLSNASWYYVDGYTSLYLWNQKCLGALALACI